MERVADGSGASDYDALAPAGWPDQRFRSEGPSCMDVAIAERDEEHDLRWLHANGFDPVGQLVVQQFFATTPDQGKELWVSDGTTAGTDLYIEFNLKPFQSGALFSSKLVTLGSKVLVSADNGEIGLELFDVKIE